MLTAKGINVTIRRELGQDINAACGQLRRDYGSTTKGTRLHYITPLQAKSTKKNGAE